MVYWLELFLPSFLLFTFFILVDGGEKRGEGKKKRKKKRGLVAWPLLL